MRRCLLNNKEEMLRSFRNIMTGGVALTSPSATVKEQLNSWIRTCDNRWHDLVRQVLPQEQPNRFELGYWTIAYKIVGLDESYDIEKLIELIKSVPKGIGVYPSWESINRSGANSSFDTDESFEWCTFKESDGRPAAWSDYGRVQSDLSFFLRSGHAEDLPNRSIPSPVPGSALFCSAPVAFLQSSLKHALYISRSLKRDDFKVLLNINWTHMQNRSLVAFSEYDVRTFPFLFGCRTTRKEINTYVGEIAIRDLESSLPDIIFDPVRAIYRAFDFCPSEDVLKNYINNFVTEYS